MTMEAKVEADRGRVVQGRARWTPDVIGECFRPFRLGAVLVSVNYSAWLAS